MVHAQCKVGLVTSLPASFADGYVFVPVSINGVAGQFLLDTGAAETVLDTQFSHDAGVGMFPHAGQFVMVGAGNKQSLPAFKGHVRMTTVGVTSFPDWLYSVMDVRGIMPASAHASGILGMDFLHYFDIELDVPSKTLNIYRLSGCKDVYPPSWKGDYDTIPLKHTPNHNVTLPVAVDDAFLDMELDTGAGRGVLLTRNAAAKAGVSDTALAHDVASQGRGIGGNFAVAHHRFAMFLIGSGVYPNADLRIENERTVSGETDGLIGLEAFHATRIWISNTTSTLFVQGSPKLAGK